MSFQAQTAACSSRGIQPLEKFLLMTLANYADPEGRCFPAQRVLVEDTGLCERTVRRLLGVLETAGLIHREERRRRDGSRASDLITLLFVNRQQMPHGHASTGTSCPTYRQDSPDQPARDAGLTTFEPVTEPVIEPITSSGDRSSPELVRPADRKSRKQPATATEQAEFDAFWAIYPRHVAKKPALDAFLVAVRRGVRATDIAQGASAYAAAREGQDPSKTAHAASWLNQERWTDEAEPSPAQFAQIQPRRGMQGYSALDQAIEGLHWENTQ